VCGKLPHSPKHLVLPPKPFTDIFDARTIHIQAHSIARYQIRLITLLDHHCPPNLCLVTTSQPAAPPSSHTQIDMPPKRGKGRSGSGAPSRSSSTKSAGSPPAAAAATAPPPTGEVRVSATDPGVGTAPASPVQQVHSACCCRIGGAGWSSLQLVASVCLLEIDRAARHCAAVGCCRS